MTTNYTLKGKKVQLNGNKLSGDTFPVKEFIKKYLNGKWSSESKSWTVDLGQVKNFTGLAYGLMPATETEPEAKNSNPHVTGNWRNGNELNDEF